MNLSNYNGFGSPDDPRADYINGENLGYGLPKIASLITGGNILSGREESGDLVIDYLDGTKAPPSTDEINRTTAPWLIQYATVAKMNCQVIRFPYLSNAERNIYLDVPVPIIASQPIWFPLSKLVKLPLGSPIPSPYV